MCLIDSGENTALIQSAFVTDSQVMLVQGQDLSWQTHFAMYYVEQTTVLGQSLYPDLKTRVRIWRPLSHLCLSAGLLIPVAFVVVDFHVWYSVWQILQFGLNTSNNGKITLSLPTPTPSFEIESHAIQAGLRLPVWPQPTFSTCFSPSIPVARILGINHPAVSVFV